MSKRVSGPRVKRKAFSKNVKVYKKPKIVKSIAPKSMQGRPLSTAMPATLHYSTRAAINPGLVGQLGQYIFRLSSIHDPDFTGVGHQPMGHDQLEPLFERYQVWKVDFKLVFATRDTNQNMRVGYRISDSSTTNTDPDVNIENGNCEWDILGFNSGGVKTMKGSINIPEVHGQSYKQYMANDDYGANFGSNPLEEAYFIAFADGLGNDTDAVDVGVQLVYHTKLMGSKLTSLS